MVRVKICGITNLSDAEHALRYGADALGFVFAESPRRIAPQKAAKIIRKIGPRVAPVGVFVNEKPENVLKIAWECQLSTVQLHGDESLATIKDIRKAGALKVIKSFRIANAADLARIESFEADAYLFDTKADGRFGGTGKSFDWTLLKNAKFRRPVILSGGLKPGNIEEAVRAVCPYGVDVSSGVEKSPGKKDPKLVKEFIERAKSV